MKIDGELLPIIDEMLMELSTEKLEICLVPSTIPEVADDGGMVRAVCSQNPKWYQDMCEAFPSNRFKGRTARKDYTKVNRRYILKLLVRMVTNGKTRSLYAPFILGVAKDRLDLYNRLEEAEKENLIPWNNQF